MGETMKKIIMILCMLCLVLSVSNAKPGVDFELTDEPNDPGDKVNVELDPTAGPETIEKYILKIKILLQMILYIKYLIILIILSLIVKLV